MDRQVVYIGQIPMDLDILNTNLNSYISIAKLSAALLGTSTQMNGFACIPNSPAALNVLVGAGEIYAIEQIDTSAYGSLPTNTTNILKQGINLTTSSPLSTPAPSTVGFSINYLIQIGFAEVDNGSQLLPYYNSANPSQAFSGPNNDALPNYTNRHDYANIQVKAGTAATTGTQTTPTPDSGFVGAWVVTVAHGQTTVTSGNIAIYPGAPFINPAITQGSDYAVDSGSANALVITPSPAILNYSAGQTFKVKVANTNTGDSTININGLGAQHIYQNGASQVLSPGDLLINRISLIVYDGTNFQLQNPLSETSIQNSVYNSAIDTGAANAYVATLTPVPSYTTGLRCTIKIVNSNTGASTINLNSLGTKNIKTKGGLDPIAGQLFAGMEADLFYDGTNFQILNDFGASTQQNSTYVYVADGGSANTYTAAYTPAVVTYVTGQRFIVKISNSNTGASTLNVNSLGAKAIKLADGSALIGAEIQSGSTSEFIYDGTNFQLVNPFGRSLINVQPFNSTGTYTPTAGMTKCIIKLVGGGGGGGAVHGSSGTVGGSGGGAGGYAEAMYTAAQIGASQAVTIGAAGLAGATPSGNGGTGGTTSVGSLLSATGGSGGLGGSASVTVQTLAAQNGGSGTISSGTSIRVNDGMPGGPSLSGGATIYGWGGWGGNSEMGPGARANVVSGGAGGVPTAGFGGGGSGGYVSTGTDFAGGAGTKGYVVIEEYA